MQKQRSRQERLLLCLFLFIFLFILLFAVSTMNSSLSIGVIGVDLFDPSDLSVLKTNLNPVRMVGGIGQNIFYDPVR